MADLTVTDVRHFVPARDFARSRGFYLAEAVSGLELLPWDVAFTFGVREA